ncbi:MAG: phosphohydrolase, partial [Candidatus Nitrosotenuis sp.]
MTVLDIVDPIHDFIRVYETELKIIDLPVFQRLRRIRQLSGAHLTYPGAQHSRFEHSLGVMH